MNYNGITPTAPANPQELITVPDFPNYMIDMENGNVWRHWKRGSWWQMKAHKKRGTYFYLLGKRWIQQARLLYAVRHGISYFDIPKGFVFFLTPDKRIEVKTLNEIARQREQERRQEIHANRIWRTEHNIEGLNVLLQAYKGNAEPLLEYIADNRKRLLCIIRKSKGFSYNTAEHAFGLAVDRLIETLRYSNSDIKCLDRWLVKTAYGMRVRELLILEKKVNIENVRSLSGNKIIYSNK